MIQTEGTRRAGMLRMFLRDRSGFSRADWDIWDTWDRGGEVTSGRDEFAGMGDKEVSCMWDVLSAWRRG
ncbi:MAG: hypothetical protein ACYDER_09385 [Ktedonobacteraceae bacterium]